jgi:hypothetical protein
MPHWKFQLIVINVFTSVSLLIANLFYLIIYKLERPNLEKHKTQNDKEWPWKTEPDEYYALLWKTIPNVIFNIFVVTPAY